MLALKDISNVLENVFLYNLLDILHLSVMLNIMLKALLLRLSSQDVKG